MRRSVVGRLAKYEHKKTAVGAHPVPLLNDEALALEQRADLAGPESDDLFEDRDEYAEGIITDDRAPGNLRNLSRLRRRDREPVTAIHVQDHRDVRLPIPDVDDLIARQRKLETEVFDGGDLAIAGRHSDHRVDFQSGLVPPEARADNVIRRDDVLQGLDHDFFRGG